jgi:hypothetical protein
MTRVGFKPTPPVFELLYAGGGTVHAFARAANVIGSVYNMLLINGYLKLSSETQQLCQSQQVLVRNRVGWRTLQRKKVMERRGILFVEVASNKNKRRFCRM